MSSITSTDTIREAVIADIPRIIEMGSRSITEGPYKNLIADKPEVTQRLAAKLVQMDTAKVLVAEIDGLVCGILCFILFPHYFTDELTAGEMIWYVEPEHRPGGIGLKLLWAAEHLAHSLGAKAMQFTAPTAEIGAIYKRFGYEPVEVTYQRKLCQSPPA